MNITRDILDNKIYHINKNLKFNYTVGMSHNSCYKRYYAILYKNSNQEKELSFKTKTDLMNFLCRFEYFIDFAIDREDLYFNYFKNCY